MIVDNPVSHFIFVYSSKFVLLGRSYLTHLGRRMTNGEVLMHWGKCIVLDDRPGLDALASTLDPYVEQGQIPVVKYDREPSRNLGIEECVLMAYCDKRRREEVWSVLKANGARFKAWVSEEETIRMWMPGGRLLERWIVSKGFDERRARVTREDAARRLGKVFSHPELPYEPWQQ